MVELIGDTCAPSDLIVPQSDTATSDTISGTKLISGLIVLNQTTSKLEFWDGTQWSPITSTGR